MTIMGWIAFAGDSAKSDPDAAEIALRRASFTVTRLPAKFWNRLAHPDDDFIIALIGGIVTNEDKALGAIMDEINAIVHGYGGLCDEVEIVPPNYVPSFDRWFEPPRHPGH
jgi:hypothetical protein